ncbi:MAG: phosphoglycolate phosphatase [Sulfurimonas sp.]
MKLTDKKLILFDLDGTLIDSVPDLAASINFTLSKLNRKLYSTDDVREWVGNGVQTLVKRAISGKKDFQEDEINKNLYEQALPIFLENYETTMCKHTYLYKGVKETLLQLKKENYKMAIITNKPHKFIAPILKQLEVDDCFELLIGADSLEKKKPDPEPLLHAMNHFGCDKKECVMVGDSKNDIVAAKNAEIESIAVTYGYNYGEDINMYAPTIVVESFENILKHLR